MHYNKAEQLHRTDGPAIEYLNGHKEWFVNGLCHRIDGPAVEWDDGSKFWYIDDKLHRIDGPAAEYADGQKEWWINGIYINTLKGIFYRFIRLGINFK